MKVCGHNYYKNYYLAQNGNVKTKVLSLLVFVIICSIFPPQVQSKYCASVEGKTGVCIPIRRCPILFKILLPGYVSRDDLRQLQKLTCGFVKNDPKVCCPVDEVVHTNWPTYRAPEESYRSHVNYKNLPTTDTCGVINATMENRIIGGTTPEIASQPWLVRLGYRSGSVENDDLIFYCGGSIINKRYILTAAHCVATEIPTIVRVGEYDSTIDPDCSAYTRKCSFVDDIGIDKIIIHSGHNPKTKMNDIALIRLSKDIAFDDDFVRPICLPLGEEFVPLGLGPSLSLSDSDAEEKNKVKKATGFVAGWGATRWDEIADSQVVQFTFLPIVSNEICRDIYSGRTVVSSKQLCAGGEDGKDSCDGDSGGPLVLYSENTQRYFHIGIVSYGPTRCGSKNLPGIYTRVTEYIPWILDHLSF